MGVIIPTGLFNVVGSLQNIESAAAADDSYETAPILAMNRAGTLAACLFGSCFPTTIYIGHPGWKALGARAGYSTLNAAFFTVVILTGTLAYITWAIPVDAGTATVLWIGVVITAQAFRATPDAHAPAVSPPRPRASSSSGSGRRRPGAGPARRSPPSASCTPMPGPPAIR